MAAAPPPRVGRGGVLAIFIRLVRRPPTGPPWTCQPTPQSHHGASLRPASPHRPFGHGLVRHLFAFGRLAGWFLHRAAPSLRGFRCRASDLPGSPPAGRSQSVVPCHSGSGAGTKPLLSRDPPHMANGRCFASVRQRGSARGSRRGGGRAPSGRGACGHPTNHGARGPHHDGRGFAPASWASHGLVDVRRTVLWGWRADCVPIPRSRPPSSAAGLALRLNRIWHLPRSNLPTPELIVRDSRTFASLFW